MITGIHTGRDAESRPTNEGFTLIEILVATAIASLILIMAYASYRSIFDSIKRSTGRSEFYENVNLAIMKIEKITQAVLHELGIDHAARELGACDHATQRAFELTYI